MTELAFFVDLAVTGTVLGLDHTSTMAEVEAVFELTHASAYPNSLVTDAGLVEFGWQRWHGGDTWTATYFGAQAHRLGLLADKEQVESPLVARYGDFPARVHVEDLLAATTAVGHPLRQVPDPDENRVAYWSPVSDLHVLAVAPDRAGEPDPPGTVLKMLGPQPWWPWHRNMGRELEFAGYARQLLATGRSAWLDAHDPVDEPPEVRRDWWGCLTNMVQRKAKVHEPVVALHREAAERAVCTVAEAALAEIAVLVRAHGKGVPAGSTDEATTRWLAHVPPGGDLRSDRVLRNQIHAVGQGLTHLTDPALADAMRPWLDLRPALLADGRAPRVPAH
ncbi:hypothetical protein [Actinophytocola glycyrrhizae]|uniref:Uncharacterized protein n=1 Tax=Actinophytocola glycyrrhizae TaxID=2044873 RepID=A0ABV9RWX5_9PSEU